MSNFQKTVIERAASIAALNAAIDAALSDACATAHALVAEARAHLECAHSSEDWGREDKERAGASVDRWRRQKLRLLDEPLRTLVSGLASEAVCYFFNLPLPVWDLRPARETIPVAQIASPVNYRMACGCMRLDPVCQHWRIVSMY